MSQIKKLWVKLTKRPTPSNIKWRDAEKILKASGFTDVKSTGSHFNYRNPKTGKRVTMKKLAQIDKGSVDDIIKAVLEHAGDESPIEWLEKRGK